ncbi:dynactin p62 family-domain-containing protein [Kickxella alabastrina]|uniref:dynactin p62 family-domain-containing protein n=1 Tax=Kickxella alabastrina TaxID=61397 RepID=UPI00221F1B07|nr:dynactin p62 family-domain-containing protein [Kickxella alabastrina]KAI7829033.1 dynactin p62 family-domain-containing protein [Kickxella alabastrina]
MMSSANNTLISVLYHCSCNGATQSPGALDTGVRVNSEGEEAVVPKASSNSELEAQLKLPLQPNSELLVLRASAIENLYYCDDCSELRCSRCVIEEPAGYHCPNCLFDVPTASVRSEKTCPVCTHMLSVVENDTETKPFSFACSVFAVWAVIIFWAGGNSVSTAVIPPYQAAGYMDTDHTRVSQRMNIENVDTVPPLSADLTSIEPQRIRLHMKLARRCRSCHHILIKPESKAQATRFKIQLMAANFLPTITLPNRLSPKTLYLPLVLRFANPLYSEMGVLLLHAHVEVVAQQFMLAPFTELWEYDEDEDEDSDGSSSGERSAGRQRGIVDRQGNRVAIQLNLTPKAITDNLTVPLFVTCTHQDDMDMDTDAPASAPAGGDSSRRTVTNKFWVYISLGPTAQ